MAVGGMVERSDAGRRGLRRCKVGERDGAGFGVGKVLLEGIVIGPTGQAWGVEPDEFELPPIVTGVTAGVSQGKEVFA